MREIVSYHPEKPQHWVDGGLARRSLLSQDHAGTQSVLLATGQGESAVQATEGSASLLPSGAPINEPAVQDGPASSTPKPKSTPPSQNSMREKSDS